MTDKLKYIHTHGKVKRCWHESRHVLGYQIRLNRPAREHFDCMKCGDKYEPPPTATLDYLVQRCEEEGFIATMNINLHHKFNGCKHFAEVNGHQGYADTPQEALTLALARALGWEGE